MKNCLRLVYAVILLVAISCNSSKDEYVYGRFTKSSETIKAGDTYRLPFQISKNLGQFQNYDFTKNPYNIQPQSSDTHVVEVVDCGTVKGVSRGRCTISIKLGGAKFSMNFTVDD